MTQTPKFKPNHRFKEVFDQLVGNTDELKHCFSEISGISIQTVNRLYLGSRKNITLQEALLIIDFANDNKLPEKSSFVVSDLQLVSTHIENRLS